MSLMDFCFILGFMIVYFGKKKDFSSMGGILVAVGGEAFLTDQ